MKNKLSVAFTLALVITSCALTYFLDDFLESLVNANLTKSISKIEDNTTENEYFHVERTNGYPLVKPLLNVEPGLESAHFSSLKTNVNQLIEREKALKNIFSASVYVQLLEKGDWMVINENESYPAGSMMKVVNLIYFLKAAEKYPHMLDKVILNDFPKNKVPEQTFNSLSISYGKSYTIRELLKYMIAYSDNYATCLLMQDLHVDIFKHLFADVQIPLPAENGLQYEINTKSYSKLMNILFQSSYLSTEHSEFALNLLGLSDFKKGIKKYLPDYIFIAHKFGEAIDYNWGYLHETGIVYYNQSPYLITIMTKGSNIEKSAEVISAISKTIFDEFTGNTKPYH